MALVLVEFNGRKVKENRSGAAAAKDGTRGRLGFSARDSFWMGKQQSRHAERVLLFLQEKTTKTGRRKGHRVKKEFR
jgi:hypothetical protein